MSEEAFVEKNCHFCRKRRRRFVVRQAGRIIRDAGFRRIGDHVFKIIRYGNFLDFLPVLRNIRIVAGIRDRNDALPAHSLPILISSKIQGIKTVLLIEHTGPAVRRRRDERNFAVPVCPFIGTVEKVIDERAEKPFPNLKRLHRCTFLQITCVIDRFQCFITEFFRHFLSLPPVECIVSFPAKACYSTLYRQ